MIRALMGMVLGKSLRAIRRPWVSLTLFMILFLDACSLPRGSVVGSFVPSMSLVCRCCSCGGRPMAQVVKENAGLWLAFGDVNEPEYEESAVIADVWCNPRRRAHGFWAITRYRWNPNLTIYPITAISAQETHEIRNLFADYLEREPWSSLPSYAMLVREGAQTYEEIVWTGYLHNGLASLVAASLIVSLGWMQDSRRAARVEWRKARGHCPQCDYELRGELSQGCPECGWGRK